MEQFEKIPPADKINHVLSLLSNGRLDQLQVEIRGLIADFPFAPILRNIQGAGLAGEGQLARAIEKYKTSVILDPGYAQGHNNLGGAFKVEGSFGQAVQSFKRALMLMPDLAEARGNIANCYLEMNDLAKAAAAFESAVALDGSDAETQNNFGAVLKELGELGRSAVHLKAAVDLNPGLLEAHNNLGAVYTGLGQFDDAEDSYRQAVRINPSFAAAYRSLSNLRTFDPDDPLIAIMENLHRQQQPHDPERAHICFALAKVYDDVGRYDQAFRYLEEGNLRRRTELDYSRGKDQTLFAEIKAKIGAIPEAIETGPDNAVTPIFIVGMPRSGTTLVEQILASHSKVHGAGELSFAEIAARELLPQIAETPPSPEQLQGFAQSYLASLPTQRGPKCFVTDKAPGNFKWIGLILNAIPHAKIVHVKRDPMATCWSIYRNYFSNPAMGYAYGLSDIAHYHHLYSDMMAFWHARFAGRILEFDYDGLTENPDKAMRHLVDWCGLDWEEACRDFHTTSRPVQTASAVQVRQKLYSGSSDSWRNYQPFLGEMERELSVG